MSKKETAKRYILFIISLFFNAMGVSLAVKGALGVSPLACIPHVMNISFSRISMGTWIFLWNCFLILMQIVLLRKNFKLIQLLQVPLAIIFGYFNDLTATFISGIPVDTYFMQMMTLIIGIIVLAFGIALSVVANVILNSGEAIVKVVSDLTKKDFSLFKTIFDIVYVIGAALLGLLLCGKVVGIREGTLISALVTGIFVKIFLKLVEKPLEKLLCDKTPAKQE